MLLLFYSYILFIAVKSTISLKVGPNSLLITLNCIKVHLLLLKAHMWLIIARPESLGDGDMQRPDSFLALGALA